MWHYLRRRNCLRKDFFFILTLKFMTQKLTKFAECICAIRLIQKSFAEFYFYNRLLHLLDFYFQLTPNSFLKELIFARKASTNFLKFLRRILSYFTTFKLNEFRKKDVLPADVFWHQIYLKPVVRVPPKKNFMKSQKCGRMGGCPSLIFTFFIFLISASILPTKHLCH